MKDSGNFLRKEIILLLFSGAIICFSFIFWLFGAKILQNIGILTTLKLSDLIAIVLSLLFYLAGIILFSIIPFPRLIKYCFFLITSIPLLFFPSTLLTNIILLIIFSGILCVFEWLAQKETQNRVRFDIHTIYNSRLSIVTVSISLLLSFQTYTTLNKDLSEITLKLPNDLVTKAVDLSAPLVNQTLENQKTSLENYVLSQLESQLPFLTTLSEEDQHQLLNGTLTDLALQKFQENGISPAQAQDFINEVANEVNNLPGLSNNDEQLIPEDSIQSVIGQVKASLESVINNLLNQNRQLFSAIISSSFLFMFNLFGFIFKIFAIFSSSLLIKLFCKLKLLNIKTVEIPAERLEIG